MPTSQTNQFIFSPTNAYGKIPKLPEIPQPGQKLYGHISLGNAVEGKSFSETLGSMLNKVNGVMGEPEKLSIEAVTTGRVDIHEVMIALGKSEVAFKLLTAITQKTVGAFDKLTSMQV
jgi:flagellar hook-basal body complex protein FliE